MEVSAFEPVPDDKKRKYKKKQCQRKQIYIRQSITAEEFLLFKIALASFTT